MKLYRYIDDLIIFGKNGIDISIKTDFYPKYLKLNATSSNTLKANCLDLNIEIINDKIITKIYDKRQSFNFDIIKIPHWFSNLHINIFRNILLNFKYRINRLTTTEYDKDKDLNMFYTYAILKEYPINFLITYLYS